jgi:Zn finger protein HypA/HybF involved in hydrogenase expression
MNKPYAASILFTCPQCNANFEFDAVGENEFVSCPVCESNNVTVKKGGKVILAEFEQILMC